MTIREKILQQLNAAYPFKLLRDTLYSGVRLDGKPVSASEFDTDMEVLIGNGYIEISRDDLDTTRVYHKITERGIRYLEKKGIA